jgi:hypothetical protein
MGQKNSCKQAMNIATTPSMESEDQGVFFSLKFYGVTSLTRKI